MCVLYSPQSPLWQNSISCGNSPPVILYFAPMKLSYKRQTRKRSKQQKQSCLKSKCRMHNTTHRVLGETLEVIKVWRHYWTFPRVWVRVNLTFKNQNLHLVNTVYAGYVMVHVLTAALEPILQFTQRMLLCFQCSSSCILHAWLQSLFELPSTCQNPGCLVLTAFTYSDYSEYGNVWVRWQMLLLQEFSVHLQCGS